MTVKALEGQLEVPADPGEAQASLGFAETTLPAGTAAVSDRFYPNPENNTGGTALFNVFLASVDFMGEIFLLKEAPSDSENFKGQLFRCLARGREFSWKITPGEALVDTVQEPENGVCYRLAIFGQQPGESISFRLSL